MQPFYSAEQFPHENSKLGYLSQSEGLELKSF